MFEVLTCVGSCVSRLMNGWLMCVDVGVGLVTSRLRFMCVEVDVCRGVDMCWFVG